MRVHLKQAVHLGGRDHPLGVHSLSEAAQKDPYLAVLLKCGLAKEIVEAPKPEEVKPEIPEVVLEEPKFMAPTGDGDFGSTEEPAAVVEEPSQKQKPKKNSKR